MRFQSRFIRVSYENINVILIFESVDHSNETSSAVLLHGSIYIQVFYKMRVWESLTLSNGF